jgi:hypothetical protein
MKIPGTQCSSVIAAGAATQTLPVRCWRIKRASRVPESHHVSVPFGPNAMAGRAKLRTTFLPGYRAFRRGKMVGTQPPQGGAAQPKPGGQGLNEKVQQRFQQSQVPCARLSRPLRTAPSPSPLREAALFGAVCPALLLSAEAARLHKAPQLPPWLRSFRRSSAGYRWQQSPRTLWSAALHASSYPRSRRSPRLAEGSANACAAATEHGNPTKSSSRRNKRERSAGEAQDQGDRRPGVCFPSGFSVSGTNAQNVM